MLCEVHLFQGLLVGVEENGVLHLALGVGSCEHYLVEQGSV